MPDDSEEYALMFGPGPNNDRAYAYSRYAVGDPLSEIAKDSGLSIQDVLALMRQRPSEFAETKQMREDFERLRVQRSLSIIDDHNLGVLEGIQAGTVVVDKDLRKELTKMAKDLAHRHALNEGKATAHMKITDELLTDEEVRDRLKAQDEAGHGLAVDDIEQ